MIIINKKPFLWVSAHRPVEYTFDYQAKSITLCTENSSSPSSASVANKMILQYDGPFTDPMAVGMLIYIDSGTYKGYHTILEIEDGPFGNFILTNTDFTVEQDTGNVKLITSHIVVLYKGSVSLPLSTYFPFEQIAEFKPEPNLNGQLVFNISGYIKKVFDVRNSNDTALINNLTVYYNLYEPIMVRVLNHSTSNKAFSAFQHRMYALNSSIDMFELNRDYVDTGRHLNSGSLGNHYRSCSITNNIMITGAFVRDDVPYDQGNAEFDGDFNNDFNADFFRRQ